MKTAFRLGFIKVAVIPAMFVLALPLMVMAEVPSNGATGSPLGLPKGYLRLKYVSNSSGQYVLTGVTPNGRVPTVHLKYQLSKTQGMHVFGYWDHAQNAGTGVGWNNEQFWFRTWQTTAGYGSWNDLDGKLERDFIPVRTRTDKLDGLYEYGLYDQVTGLFFRNAADAGAFTGGPDVKVSGLRVIIY